MKLKKIWKITFSLIVVFIILLVGISILYEYEISPVDKKDTNEVVFKIEKGTGTKTIGKNLENASLIHDANFFVFYVKIHNISNLQASTYKLKRSMNLKEIIEIINKGDGFNPNEVKITFKEGKNIRSIAKTIEANTNNKYDDILKKINDSKYVDSLIEKYWFLDKTIKSSDIYYPLEGYLFPSTYIFNDKDVSVETIITKMLNKTSEVLTKYKDDISKSNMSVHEILTFASIVELEGANDTDRPNVASVFYNRIAKKMSLGSDVTACYAQKIDDTYECHNKANFNYNSKYNTRLLNNLGLPIGAICSPGEGSIKAVLKPAKTGYLYFVADKNKKMYFFNTKDEFDSKIKELKKNGDWL